PLRLKINSIPLQPVLQVNNLHPRWDLHSEPRCSLPVLPKSPLKANRHHKSTHRSQSCPRSSHNNTVHPLKVAHLTRRSYPFACPRPSLGLSINLPSPSPHLLTNRLGRRQWRCPLARVLRFPRDISMHHTFTRRISPYLISLHRHPWLSRRHWHRYPLM